MARSLRRTIAAIPLLLASGGAEAQSSGVYHPYVNAGEREIEYGVTWRDVGGDTLALQRASVGYAWNERLATELYFLSTVPGRDGGRVHAYELEARWQLTEQGEYASDWGLLFEAEWNNDERSREVAVGVLWEKELRRPWVASANYVVEYEFGDGVDDEIETAFRGQLRYLHRPAFEPAIEIYLDDEDYSLGPAWLGARRWGPGRQLRWQLGALFGIGHGTPARSVRALLEFEF